MALHYHTPTPLGYDGVRWVRLGYIGGWGRAPAARQARGPSAAARQARGPSAAARGPSAAARQGVHILGGVGVY